MKILSFSNRRVFMLGLYVAIAGTVGIVVANRDQSSSELLKQCVSFSLLGPALVFGFLRTMSPRRLVYNDERIVFSGIISSETVVQWDALEKISSRSGAQKIFKFALTKLYLFPFCYEPNCWQDFFDTAKAFERTRTKPSVTR